MVPWILDHLQLVIVIGGAVAYWLNQRKLAQEGGEEAPPEKSFEDPVLAERTRRIREDIQRKIAQRAGGRTAPPPPVAPPELAGLPPLLQELLVGRPAPVVDTRAEDEIRRRAEILEQQATMAEKLKQAEEMKVQALRRQRFEAETADKKAAAVGARNVALTHDLRDPAALRRAFVLREVLGPPVALR